MARPSGDGGFAVSIGLADDGARLGIGLEPPDAEGRRARIARINGAPAGSALAFSDYVRLVWLTPDLAPELRAPVTAAISSLLLFEELRKNLPE